MFDQLSEGEQDFVLKVIADFVLDLSVKIDNLVAVRGLNNAPSTVKLPPVLSHQLIDLSPRQFYELMNQHKLRLDYSFSPSFRTQVEDSFNMLRKEIRSCQSMEGTDTIGFDSFERLWKPLKHRFEPLIQFCAGLASVFPGTATVEAEFSFLGQEESSQRNNISKLAISGAMHSRQWNDVRRGSLQLVLDKIN